MQLIIKQIGIYAWIAYFLFSTTGVSLQSLYCYCTNTGYISVFSIEHNCKEHHEPKEATKPCCKNKKTCHLSEELEQQDKNCCDPISKFVKADVESSFSNTNGSDFDYSPTTIIPSISVNYPISYKGINSLKYRPPPPKLYGVELRHFLQSYLC